MTEIAIVGYEEGGAGQVQAWMEALLGFHVLCFVNPDDQPPQITNRPRRDASQFDYPTAETFKGKPLISARDWPSALKRRGIERFIAIVSNNSQRLDLLDQGLAAGLEPVNAIHPTALVMEDAILGRNLIIMARAVIGYRAEVHDAAFIHIGTQLDHHCVARRGAMAGPAAILAGNVTLGERSLVLTGANVANRIRIGDDAVVGAGAAVIRDVPPGVTVAGVPARQLKPRS